VLNPRFRAFNEVRQIFLFGFKNEKINQNKKVLAKCLIGNSLLLIPVLTIAVTLATIKLNELKTEQ
jgi:hypothetical protein